MIENFECIWSEHAKCNWKSEWNYAWDEILKTSKEQLSGHPDGEIDDEFILKQTILKFSKEYCSHCLKGRTIDTLQDIKKQLIRINYHHIDQYDVDELQRNPLLQDEIEQELRKN